MKLFTPNATYIAQVENGKNYLNCPKFLFNEALHSITRGQGKLALLSFLKGIHYPQANKVVDEVYDNFIHVHPERMRQENPNSYIDKPLSALPSQVRATDARLIREIEQAKPVWDWIKWSIGVKFDPNIYRQANGIKQFARGW